MEITKGRFVPPATSKLTMLILNILRDIVEQLSMLFVRVAVLIFRLTLISTADQTESNQSPYYDKARYFCLYFCFSDAWFFRPSHFKNKIVARRVRHKAITGRYVILKLYFKTEKQIIYHPKFRYLNTSKDIRAKTQFKPIKYWLMCYITRN